MLDKTQIMQMLDGIKTNIAELESALGEGEAESEGETSSEENAGMENGKMGMGMAKKMASEAPEDEEEMPPMLKKFVHG